MFNSGCSRCARRGIWKCEFRVWKQPDGDMGSGTSRGKKVAPACVSEVNATKTAAAGTSAKQDGSSPFKPIKIHAILRNARNRAQPDCHSEGHDSDFSREDDDIDGELDTVLADEEERGGAEVKKSPPKKTVVRSKTYGLCHFRQEDEEDLSSEEPRGSHGGDRVVNKRSNDAFTHFKKHTPASPSQHSVRTFFLFFKNDYVLFFLVKTCFKMFFF